MSTTELAAPNIAVVTDSTSDLRPEQLAEWNITSVPLYVLFDGHMYKDGLEITPARLFRGLREGKPPPSTSQPSPAEFEEAYKGALTGADHVLSVHLSGQLSGTVGSARLAAQQFPGQVTVLDSGSVSGGLGLQALRAARRAREGAILGDIVAELEREGSAQSIRFLVDTLEFLKLNGRIGGARALLGSLLNIKPILAIKGGKVEAAGQVRGGKKALANMLDYARTYVEGHGRTRFMLLSTEGAEQAVGELRAGLDAQGLEDAGVLPLGAVVATHAGPGTVGMVLEPVGLEPIGLEPTGNGPA